MQKRNPELVRNLTPDFVRRGDAVIPHLSIDNVSNPPTDAQLDTAFGAPATLPDPFLAIVDDAGAASVIWLVVATNGVWAYEQLAIAV